MPRLLQQEAPSSKRLPVSPSIATAADDGGTLEEGAGLPAKRAKLPHVSSDLLRLDNAKPKGEGVTYVHVCAVWMSLRLRGNVLCLYSRVYV